MEVNQGTINSLHVGFSTIFGATLEVAKSDWGAIATKVPSSTRRNEYSWMRNMPQLRRNKGPKTVESLVRQGYSIENESYSSFVEISVDDIEDDNLGTYRMVFQEHAEEAAAWVSNAVMSLLPMGLTSDGQGFDGVNFFSASHPKLGGGTYSNFDSGGSAPWYLLDTRRSAKPLIFQERKPLALTVKNRPEDDNVFDDDMVRWSIKGRFGFGYSRPQLAYCSQETLNDTNLRSAVQAMLAQVRDDGTKLNVMPDILVVGPTNYFAAKELVESLLDSDGGTNIHKGTLRVIQSPYVESVSLDIAPAG